MKRYLSEIYITATLLALVLSLFLMKPAVMPFFLASAIAYLSYPAFQAYLRLTRGRKRLSAILTIFSIMLVLSIALFVVLPVIVSQIQSFVNYLPKLLEKLDAFIYRVVGEHFLKKLNFDASTLQSILKSIYLQLGEVPVSGIVQRLFSGVFSVIGILVNTVLVPLIAYYFLVNAQRIKEIYLLVAPAEIREELGELVDEVHNALSNYLMGQGMIAVFVGIYIAFGLYLTGIKYAFLIGFVSGVLNMIPYVGFFSGLIPSILLAIFDNGDLPHVAGVLTVFLTEVSIENLIYPMVMSRATGVNPLLVLIAIFIGGYLGGFLGIVIAVPTAVMVVPVFKSFLEKKENSVAGRGNG